MTTQRDPNAAPVLALCGGVGGAKLVLGLDSVLPQGALTVGVNVGDDFTHLGLRICPDIDTVLYTLGGLADPERGWGRRDETWTFMKALAAWEGEEWFLLGDGDLALHVERTRRLQQGETLAEVIDALRRKLGIAAAIVPVSNQPIATRLRTSQGWLDFQHYFVRLRCAPVVSEVAYVGAEDAQTHEWVLACLRDPELRAIVLCPSNPVLSVGPILAVPGLRQCLRDSHVPVIAVSPIIADAALKGPTTKLMHELGLPHSARAVAELYNDFVDAFVLDPLDAETVLPHGMTKIVAPAVMNSMEQKRTLATAVLSAADAMRANRGNGRATC